jgi:hypothetical protein
VSLLVMASTPARVVHVVLRLCVLVPLMSLMARWGFWTPIWMTQLVLG